MSGLVYSTWVCVTCGTALLSPEGHGRHELRAVEAWITKDCDKSSYTFRLKGEFLGRESDAQAPGAANA